MVGGAKKGDGGVRWEGEYKRRCERTMSFCMCNGLIVVERQRQIVGRRKLLGGHNSAFVLGVRFRSTKAGEVTRHESDAS